jgi:hypothetical protein
MDFENRKKNRHHANRGNGHKPNNEIGKELNAFELDEKVTDYRNTMKIHTENTESSRIPRQFLKRDLMFPRR